MFRFNCAEHGAVHWRQTLIAASAVAGVKNRFARFVEFVGITRIKTAEIREQRNQMLAAVINAASRAVNCKDFPPRINIAALKRGGNIYFD